MKKLSELRAEDFPGVTSEKFSEWQQAQINAERNSSIALVVYAMLGLISIFVLKVTGFVPAILMIAGIAVLGILINGKANRLAKESGITKDMIKKARRN